VHRAALTLGLIALGCGGATTPSRAERAAAAPPDARAEGGQRPPPARPALPPRVSSPIAAPGVASTEPPSRDDLRSVVESLRPALSRCHDEPALTEASARCTCEVICRARFAPREGITEVRYPFVDVDGLVFTIASSGRVRGCEYSYRAQELAAVECSP